MELAPLSLGRRRENASPSPRRERNPLSRLNGDDVTRTLLPNPFARGLLFLLAPICIALAGCGDSGSGGTSGEKSGTGQETPAPPPNVIFISIDTLRPDHLGLGGYDRETSPFLDEFAKRGVLFDNAFAQASWTLPSHMSMLTSSYPHTHRVETQSNALPETVPTLAGAFRDAGYTTLGYITWLFLTERYGFGKGFDRYDEILPTRDPETGAKLDPNAERLVDEVLSTFVHVDRTDPATGEDVSPPFFLFLHLFDPHLDYAPPLEYAQKFDPTVETTEIGTFVYLQGWVKDRVGNVPEMPADLFRQVKALYDGEIAYVDDQLRRLFGEMEQAGLLENTVIAITSDHGEEFFEHGSIEGHQWTLYDEVLHVPLLLVFPDGRRAGERNERIVETIDIAPTLLGLAGVPVPDRFEGRSLLTALDPQAEWDERTYSQIKRFNQKWAMRTPTHKIIYTADTKPRFAAPIVPGYELYDLIHDPGETENIYAEEDSLSKALTLRLKAWARQKSDEEAGLGPQLSEEERERLKSVGYIGN